MSPALLRASAIYAVVLAGQLVFLFAIVELTPIHVAFVNTALLLGSTSLLGNVWALRQYLTRHIHPAPAAALVPLVATALFLSPRLAVSAPPDALLTLAASLASVAPTQLAWSTWIAPRPPALSCAADVVSPVCAVALVALASCRDVSVLLACAASVACAGVLAFFAVKGARRAEDDAKRVARHVRDVRVLPDSLVLGVEPEVNDRWLVELTANLRERAREFAEEARASVMAEAEIAHARQLRARFMASMSHELRSPLNSIVGFSKMLEGGLDGPLLPEQLENVTMIRRASEELIRLLTDTLDLARLEAGKLRLHRAWVPSVEILTEAVARGRALVEGRDVTIEAELQPGLPPVYVDSERIVQAVVALFRHAARSLRGATVRLRARIALGPPGPPTHLRVEFYDALGALAKEEVELIFEAFQEIAEPTGRRVGGLGMSLSLSRSLVRLHGGDIWASSAPGAGTVLCVALPLDDAEVTP